MFRDERFFGPNPDEFIPSRFTEGTVDKCAAERNLTTAQIFVPFLNISQHTCLVRYIAEIEATFILLAWSKRYKFSLAGPMCRDLIGVSLAPDAVLVRAMRR